MGDLTSLPFAIRDLFLSWAGEPLSEWRMLGANGSNRRYYRLQGASHRCIAAENDNVSENVAFIEYGRAMLRRGINVPEIYAVSDDRRYYLQQDLGDTTLYDYLRDRRLAGGGFDAAMLSLYRRVLGDLALMQTRCRDIDFSVAYPRAAFDRQSMMWDLQYFKYFFLKLTHIPFDEQRLEDDFGRLCAYLLSEDCGYFMYRDFQSRNIMLDFNAAGDISPRLCYIDFQGARRGAAQYDAASILYSAKTDMPEPLRQSLLADYVAALRGAVDAMPSECRPVFDEARFIERFYGYLLLRIMQTLGAYGYRGWFERKEYFLQSIPLALANLRHVLADHFPPVDIPYLRGLLETAVDFRLPSAAAPAPLDDTRLTVSVCSFSYKRGLPVDDSGHGGGFVFDCRALPNPGRYAEYRTYTGKDQAVIDFLKDEAEVKHFLDNVYAVIDQSVKKYIERRFTRLSVAFGCTGGQHRSVYCAEQTARHLQGAFDCEVCLTHREL